MSDIKVATTWDQIPPVLYDGDEAWSTRVLEKQNRDAIARAEAAEAKLAEIEGQEPVATIGASNGILEELFTNDDWDALAYLPVGTKLYTAPVVEKVCRWKQDEHTAGEPFFWDGCNSMASHSWVQNFCPNCGGKVEVGDDNSRKD